MPLCLEAHCQATWHVSDQTYLGTTHPLLHWCKKIPVIYEQIWGLASTSICECGVLDQTAAHVILERPLHPENIMDWSYWITRFNAGLITSSPNNDEATKTTQIKNPQFFY